MAFTRWTPVAALWFLSLTATAAPTSAPPDPLFLSNDILDVQLRAPLSTIMSERGSDDEFDGQLRYVADSGEPVEIDVGVRTRGRFRMQRRICRFAPLRLNFKKKQTKDSLFHKQDKVKLVTHCVDGRESYEQGLLREYLAYRILNELTEVSFRVRLLRITYIDTEGGSEDRNTFGFIVEDRDRLAKRLGLSAVDIERTWPSNLQPNHMNLVSLFHYLIGNTDFSPVEGSKEVCCHNHTLIGHEGELLYSVPYDFDQAGLVDAVHAQPNPRFRISSVRQRRYRGRCANNGYLDATIAHYQERRAAILRLIDEQPGITESTRKKMFKYVTKFYETISSPRLVKRRLIRNCI